MISKNKLKTIHSLALKRNRDTLGLFVAEGPKVVGDLMRKFRCNYLVATSEWLKQAPTGLPRDIEEVNEEELRKISFLQHPQKVLAVFEKSKSQPMSIEIAQKELCIALDAIQDPGNLGTIVRLADWFGISHLICSQQCADAFGPKVVQATMGALARVNVSYCPLNEFLSEASAENIPIYGTFLEGDNIYQQTLCNQGILLMGNEGNGISEELKPLVSQKLFIPNYPTGRATSESLNVAVATAIACSEFRRQAITKK